MTPEAFNSDNYFETISSLAAEFKTSVEYHQAVDLLFSCWQQEGIVFTMGCGGSASTATHFASDLAKTTIVPDRRRFKAFSLVDNIPLVSAWINDSGWGTIFAAQLDPWLTGKDVLVGFSVHGGSCSHKDTNPWSQNLTAAMKLAKQRGAKIIGFSGFDGGAMKQLADVNLLVPVDYEPYATPVIEAFHVVLHHGLIFDLKGKIEND